MSWIEKQADAYAESIRQELTLRPIEGVNPNIASNAHKMGYLSGAYDVHNRYVRTVLDMQHRLSNWKLFGWLCFGLMIVFIVLCFLLCISYG